MRQIIGRPFRHYQDVQSMLNADFQFLLRSALKLRSKFGGNWKNLSFWENGCNFCLRQNSQKLSKYRDETTLPASKYKNNGSPTPLLMNLCMHLHHALFTLWEFQVYLIKVCLIATKIGVVILHTSYIQLLIQMFD